MAEQGSPGLLSARGHGGGSAGEPRAASCWGVGCSMEAPGVLCRAASTPPTGTAWPSSALELEPRGTKSLRATGFIDRESVGAGSGGHHGTCGAGAARGGVPGVRSGNQVASARPGPGSRGGTSRSSRWEWSRLRGRTPHLGEHLTLAEGSTERARLGVENGPRPGGGRVGYGLSLDRTPRWDSPPAGWIPRAPDAGGGGEAHPGGGGLRGGLPGPWGRVPPQGWAPGGTTSRGRGSGWPPGRPLSWLPSGDVTLTPWPGGDNHQLVRFVRPRGGSIPAPRLSDGGGVSRPLFRVLGASQCGPLPGRTR